MRRTALLTLLVYAVAGCGDGDPDHDQDDQDDQDDHDAVEHEAHAEEHHHAPKWGGQLVELGDHFANLEVVHDAREGTLTLYMLDAHAHQSVRLQAPSIPLTLTVGGEDILLECRAISDTLTGEKPGDSSQFEGRAAALKGLRSFRAKIAELNVSGQTFRNIAFKYEADE